jgi:hypothetical protein
MEKQIKLKGTILGVNFDVVVSGGTQPEKVTGVAGGHPVFLNISDDDDSASARGTLLGHPVEITISK